MRFGAVAVGGADEDFLVELDGFFLGFCWVGRFGGSGEVFAVIKNSCPVEFGGGREVDDQLFGVALDGLNAFFYCNSSAHA